jgi:phosphoribosyl 1,2-cyclic phosphodiesterase
VQVTFWGTRGSIPKPGPTTLRYGGNTSCVAVRSDAGTLVVVDCGTGAHDLGQHLMADAAGSTVDGHILISHTHWDHIQGLPFFAPLFQPGNTWHIFGPRGLESSIRETLSGQMQYSYFPITPDQMNAAVDYHDLVEGTFDIGDIEVHTHYLNHPALTLGYRLEADGASVVYSSDHEPHDRELADGGDMSVSRTDSRHVEFLRDADLVIHDTQYLGAEYAGRVGWGHSTVEYVVDAACQAGVRTLAIYHHDPGRTDDDVDAIVELARDRAAASGVDIRIIGAAEGLTVDVAAGIDGAAIRARPDRRSARRDPAIESERHSIVMLVPTPEIAALLRDAARAEGVDLRDAVDVDDAVGILSRQGPAVVLVEDTPQGTAAELARAMTSLGRERAAATTVVAVGATRPVGVDDLAEWLVWPSTLGYVRTKLRAWLLRHACRWQNAPLPADEERRLQSLRDLQVLDTEPEPRFDRITRLASTTLDVPVALVSLVDADRQWFKSRIGLNVAESPRDTALCAHAILGEGVMQVPDTLADERFADNPLVAHDPRVRFYAGAPLTLSNGTKAGTLCVIDYRPRLLDEAQVAELSRFARLVTDELERD